LPFRFQEYGSFELFHVGEFAKPVEPSKEVVGEKSIDLDNGTRARRKTCMADLPQEAYNNYQEFSSYSRRVSLPDCNA
jgi:hypothetical protein